MQIQRVLLIASALLLLATSSGMANDIEGKSTTPRAPQAIQAPVLKWERGGCYASWCETGWYSSPAVADLDGDGTMEVIGAAYTLFALNGEDGSVQWSVDPDGGRVWPGVAVVDLDNDGDLEIVTAHGSGYVHVFDHAGDPVWSQQPSSSELRGLSVYDLDDDGTMEVIVTAAVGSKTNTWVLEHPDGATRAGWPQLNNDSGYAWGVFNDNAAVGDLDGDGVGEIVVPSDVHYICAYEPNGVQIPAHSMYGDKAWGAVGVHVDHEVDLRGYAHCGTEHRPNFAHSPAIVVDVNGDGILEVVVVGNNYNCGANPYTSLYEMPYIFNADRTRWSGNSFDWTVIPTPDSNAAPLSESYSVIENNQPNPVVADLDGDGNKEILFSSYDGRVHAFWLDKTEHHNWPYSVYNAGEGFYRFASEPVVADLDNDGHAEVIFASWPQKGGERVGKLHILDYQGNVLHEINLPAPHSGDWNGGLAAPTLANIDADADLEVVLNTAHSGFVAYDLPGTQNARILWGTGRGNYQRSGSLLQGSLEGSSVNAHPISPGPGDVVTYTITLRNSGPTLPNARVTSTLSSQVNSLGNLIAPSGSYGEAGGVITWTGAVAPANPITITYGGTLNLTISGPQAIHNPIEIDDGLGYVKSLTATVIANSFSVYLPIIQK